MSHKDITLVILASGLGRRFGGNKQISAIGLNGESLMEFSVYDALKAGFNKIIFVTNQETEEYLDPLIASFPPSVKIKYARQEWQNNLQNLNIPKDRIRPLGTGHAVLCAAPYINEPFAVINSDDYYGVHSFNKMAVFLKSVKVDDNSFAMIGYPLASTLSDNGKVNRGICRYSTYPHVSYIEEFTDILKTDNIITGIGEAGKSQELKADELISLNFWGFTPHLFPALKAGFKNFFTAPHNGEDGEYHLPSALCEILTASQANLTMIKSKSKWYGMTYQKDLASLRKTIYRKIRNNEYPEKLWDK